MCVRGGGVCCVVFTPPAASSGVGCRRSLARVRPSQPPTMPTPTDADCVAGRRTHNPPRGPDARPTGQHPPPADRYAVPPGPADRLTVQQVPRIAMILISCTQPFPQTGVLPCGGPGETPLCTAHFLAEPLPCPLTTHVSNHFPCIHLQIVGIWSRLSALSCRLLTLPSLCPGMRPGRLDFRRYMPRRLPTSTHQPSKSPRHCGLQLRVLWHGQL